jgi:hypothetical protein
MVAPHIDDTPICPQCRSQEDCDCPQDADGPIYCLHGKDVDTFCVDCAVEVEIQLAAALARALNREGIA